MQNPMSAAHLLQFFLLSMAFTPNAHAYLDPGTGSFLLQMLVAGAFGVVLYVKMFWTSTKMFFYNLFSQGKGKEVGGSETEPDNDLKPGS